MQGLPSVIQMALIYLAPESPRWLISKGRDTEAIKILAYYHADDNRFVVWCSSFDRSRPDLLYVILAHRDDPLVQYEYEEIKASLELDRGVACNVGWSSLFATVGNRKRMRIIIALAFFSQWSGNGLVSYYLNQVFETIGIRDATVQVRCVAMQRVSFVCSL